ncbi:MAG: hypothetical protein K0R38_2332 [Polyangiaceae bacterium]|jgi:hypothetical protein|nr:hypothetical protein [Polyangiaceae bacterium]
MSRFGRNFLNVLRLVTAQRVTTLPLDAKFLKSSMNAVRGYHSRPPFPDRDAKRLRVAQGISARRILAVV